MIYTDIDRRTMESPVLEESTAGLLSDPVELAELQIWTEPECKDLLAVERGELSQEDFHERYSHRKAILVLDMTGFTDTSLTVGTVPALLRILTIQRICKPVLENHNATLVRAFADDLVALFDDPADALAAAFESHRRVAEFTDWPALAPAAACCIGIGYGDVYAIGPNLAMGAEMNCASKLGEDTAVAGETLLTESMHRAVKDFPGASFTERSSGELSFTFLSATRTTPGNAS
jgi:adenylate cyclase